MLKVRNSVDGRQGALAMRAGRLLLLGGALLFSGVAGTSGALAAQELNSSPTWDAGATAAATDIILSFGGANNNVSTSSATTAPLGNLAITGAMGQPVKLTVRNDLTFGGGLTFPDYNSSLAIEGATLSVQNLDGSKGFIAIGSKTTKGQIVVGGVSAGGSATFGQGSNLAVYVRHLGDAPALLGQNNAQLSVAGNPGGAFLAINGAKTGTYKITRGFTAGAIAADAWLGDNLHMGAAGTVSGAWSGADYTVTIRLANAETNFPRLSSGMTSLLDAMSAEYGQNDASSNAGVRFASRALSSNYIGTNDPSQAAATIEGAAQAAAVGAVQGATLSAQRAGIGALVARTSLAKPMGEGKGASIAMHEGEISSSGLSAGSSPQNGLGLWIMPLWQNENVSGMKAESFTTGYNSNLGGVALGVDYTIESALRFGLAFNLGGGYATSNGDFNKTDNSFNFWGLAAYGGWTQNNFAITADVGYASTFNKVRQDIPAVMQFDNLKADVNAHAWSAGLRTEYKIETSALDITPHLGLRYTGLTSQGHSIKGGGGTVFEVDEEFQAFWTFPVGVTFSKDLVSDSGWTFRPALDLGVIPAAGDVKARSRVHIPGVNGSAEMKTQVMDYLTFDGTAGFEVQKDNLALGLNYNLQASEHRTGHGVLATLRYEF